MFGARNPQVGSGGGSTTIVNNNYTVVSGTTLVMADASSSEITVTLPAAASNANSTVTVVKTDTTANRVIITAVETVSGQVILTKQKEWSSYTSDSSTWSQTSQPGIGINARAYGCKGDDTTDDTTALQAVLTLSSLTGEEARLPAGTYRVSSTLTLDRNTKLAGEGYSSIIKVTDTPGNCFRILELKENEASYTIDNVVIANLCIDGNYSTRSSTASSQPAIALQNANNVIIQNVLIKDNYQGGITIWNDDTSSQRVCKNVKIINCTFQNLGFQDGYMPEGISISGGEDISVEGCTFKDIWSIAGINIEALSYSLTGVIISNCHFENTNTWGIQIKDGSGGGYRMGVNNVVVTDNIFKVARYGILASLDTTIPQDIVISNNIVDGGATLYRGRTNTRVGVHGFAYYLSDESYWHDHEYTGIVLIGGTIPTGKWGIYKFEIQETDDVINCLPGADNATGYDTEALAVAALPATTASHIAIGYVTVQAHASNPFIPGTSALQNGTGGNPAQVTRYYSLPMSDRSGIYGNNCVVTGNIVKNFNADGIFAVNTTTVVGNKIDNCDKGVTIYGTSSGRPPFADMGAINVTGNTIRDCRLGIEVQDGYAQAIISSNRIHASRPVPAMTYGVYCVEGTHYTIHETSNYITDYTVVKDNIPANQRFASTETIGSLDTLTRLTSNGDFQLSDSIAHAQLDGVDEYFTGGDNLDIGLNDVSVSFWVNTTDVAGVNNRFFSKGYVTGFGSYLTADGEIGTVIAYGYPTRSAYSAEDGDIVGDGKWHFVAITWDRDGYCKRYIDGHPTGTDRDISALVADNITSALPFVVGAEYTGSVYQNFITAGITDFRIWVGGVWSAANVLAQYTTGRFNLTDGSTYTAAWHFNEQSNATVIVDQVGAIDLTPAGGTPTNFGTHSKVGGVGLLQTNNDGIATSTDNITATTVSCSPTISSGAGVPGSTPAKVGDVYIDTTGKKIYHATGITNSADWTVVN